ncbi:MAG: PD-(D/E)XK nuclease family protein, partial [Bacteroidales bacterium]|nr:PD-(D/E)XK nuclease family protein [Bacteroidales bacterium]
VHEALEHLSFAEWTERVAVASPDERSLEPLAEDKVRFGTYAHDLLARVRHAGDVEEAVAQFARQTALTDDERERLTALAHGVVSHPDSERFFREEYDVKNECDLTDGLTLGRPDRVVFTPDETWVVDFKTGRDLGEVHDRQVRHYCQAVSEMGYPQVSGWLLYLLPEVRVRRVALG